MLNELVLEMIVGDILPVFNLDPGYEPTTNEPHDGGVTDSW